MGKSLHYSSPLDELHGFLDSINPQTALNPNNPLGEHTDPSASLSNPNMNPSNPNAWNNPSNPAMNPDMPGADANRANPRFNPGMPGADNNPSNPKYNPAMPGAVNNPSNPAMNPDMPGSMMNPSNPMHNPAFPTPSPYPRPQGVGPDASLPPSLAFSPRQADNYTQDSREWPDPTEPRASQPPAQRGCTCAEGLKLECPIHGMHPEEPDLDHSWSLPEGSPVGFPQNVPRTWTQVSSKAGRIDAHDEHKQSKDEEKGEHATPEFGVQRITAIQYTKGHGHHHGHSQTSPYSRTHSSPSDERHLVEEPRSPRQAQVHQSTPHRPPSTLVSGLSQDTNMISDSRSELTQISAQGHNVEHVLVPFGPFGEGLGPGQHASQTLAHRIDVLSVDQGVIDQHSHRLHDSLDPRDVITPDDPQGHKYANDVDGQPNVFGQTSKAYSDATVAYGVTGDEGGAVSHSFAFVPESLNSFRGFVDVPPASHHGSGLVRVAEDQQSPQGTVEGIAFQNSQDPIDLFGYIDHPSRVSHPSLPDHPDESQHDKHGVNDDESNHGLVFDARQASPSRMAGQDPLVCRTCGSPMTEPKMMGTQWMNHCTRCGLYNQVDSTHPLLQQQRQALPVYPQLLQDVGPERAWVTSKQGMAADPYWLDHWMEKKGPYLYHRSPMKNIPSILEHGLLPWDHPANSSSPVDDGDLLPRPNHVYLRHQTPEQLHNLVEWAGNKEHVRVDLRKLDPHRLNPDEDSMYDQETLDRFGLPEAPNIQSPKVGEPSSWGEWAQHHNLTQPSQTAWSLEEAPYTIAHDGPIPSEAIDWPYTDDKQVDRGMLQYAKTAQPATNPPYNVASDQTRSQLHTRGSKLPEDVDFSKNQVDAQGGSVDFEYSPDQGQPNGQGGDWNPTVSGEEQGEDNSSDYGPSHSHESQPDDTQGKFAAHQSRIAHKSLEEIMSHDSDYGEMFINRKHKKLYLNIGDAFGDLVDEARDAAHREYPGYHVEVMDEGAQPRNTERLAKLFEQSVQQDLDPPQTDAQGSVINVMDGGFHKARSHSNGFGGVFGTSTSNTRKVAPVEAWGNVAGTHSPRIAQGYTPPEAAERLAVDAADGDGLVTLYHNSPNEDRARIKAWGLMPSRPARNPVWYEKGDGRMVRDQPEGVYLSPKPSVFHNAPQGTGVDMWSVRVDPNRLTKDPVHPMAFVHDGPIAPDQIEMYRDYGGGPQHWRPWPKETAASPQRPYYHVGGLTVNQQARLRQELEQTYGPEKTNVLHRFPDGWSIHHLPTWNEVGREGEMMHHCWAGMDGDESYDDPDGDMAVSLRDPSSWPHVSFHWSPSAKVPYDFGGHGGYQSEEDSPYWRYINEFTQAQGGEHPQLGEPDETWPAEARERYGNGSEGQKRQNYDSDGRFNSPPPHKTPSLRRTHEGTESHQSKEQGKGGSPSLNQSNRKPLLTDTSTSGELSSQSRAKLILHRAKQTQLSNHQVKLVNHNEHRGSLPTFGDIKDKLSRVSQSTSLVFEHEQHGWQEISHAHSVAVAESAESDIPSVIGMRAPLYGHKRVFQQIRQSNLAEGITPATLIGDPYLGSPYDTNPDLHTVREAKAIRPIQDVREVPSTDAWSVPSFAQREVQSSWSMDDRDEGSDVVCGLWSLISNGTQSAGMGSSTRHDQDSQCLGDGLQRPSTGGFGGDQEVRPSMHGLPRQTRTHQGADQEESSQTRKGQTKDHLLASQTQARTQAYQAAPSAESQMVVGQDDLRFGGEHSRTMGSSGQSTIGSPIWGAIGADTQGTYTGPLFGAHFGSSPTKLFEYHCLEDPSSSDAEAWYRSHQPVTVNHRLHDIDEEDVGPMYNVSFADGHTHDVFGHELVDHPSQFIRPDPPTPEEARTMAAQPDWLPHQGSSGSGPPQDYFHVAPTEDRARILQHGLQPSYPGINPHWEDESGISPRIKEQPTGVYLQGDPQRAFNWIEGDPKAWDLWKVPGHQVKHITPDPLANPMRSPGGAWVAPHGVYPQLEQGGPERGLEEPRGGPERDEDWADYHDLWDLPLPSDEDWRQWGIGKPNHVWGKTANKLHNFLMNPKSRPDLQTPRAQQFLKTMGNEYHNDKTDALMPWLTREWKKGRLKHNQLEHNLEHHAVGRALPDEIKNGLRQYGEGQAVDIPGVGLPELYHQLHAVNRLSVSYPTDDGYEQALHPRTLDHWADFMRSNHPVQRELGDIMKHDVGSVTNHVQRWDQAMAEEARQQALEGGHVVHTTPDGWTVRNLTTPEELKGEGDSMGHCVGGYHHMVANGDTMIHSLRDPQGVPHATVEIQPTQYESPYDGVTTEQYGGDEGRELNQPIPHRGQIVQIQGKANQDPLPEYKERLKNWFDTFHPDEKPQWEESGDYLMDPDAIEDKHLRPEGDEYGLSTPTPSMDYPALLNGLIEGRGGYRNPQYDPAMGERVYQLARAHGQIPEFANEVQNFGERQQDSFDEWRDQNYQNTVPYPQGDEQYPLDINGGTYNNAEEHENAHDQDMSEWQKEHAGMQATNHLYSLINPHYQNQNGVGGYANEPQQTFSYTNR